ncbi:MarR family winged helix-turn-helix transcriptional regulator [Salipaludibacillus sp. HK11]|uniref:MarR family winged helix-turn-helix transcriptional regulator n=1 Tax=Salipaludibacillus sp. HK11 TaxID=3394320 RepID=UPI0039FC5F9A
MKNKTLFENFVAFTSAVHQVTNDMTKEVKSDTITPVQYKILEFITISSHVTLSGISNCLNISMPNASRELKKLYDAELCEKAPNSNDRRKQFIHLTSKGEQMMNESFKIIETRFNKRMENVTQEEKEEINQAIEILQKKIFYN